MRVAVIVATAPVSGLDTSFVNAPELSIVPVNVLTKLVLRARVAELLTEPTSVLRLIRRVVRAPVIVAMVPLIASFVTSFTSVPAIVATAPVSTLLVRLSKVPVMVATVAVNGLRPCFTKAPVIVETEPVRELVKVVPPADGGPISNMTDVGAFCTYISNG